MLRSALPWRVDQNDQIAASSMCSCVVLARSDRRPAGAGTRWTLGNVVAPEQGWTINFGQDIPERIMNSRSQDIAQRVESAGDEPLTAAARTARLTAAHSDLAQHAITSIQDSRIGAGQHGWWGVGCTAKQGMQLERSGVGGSSSTELRRHHLRR